MPKSTRPGQNMPRRRRRKKKRLRFLIFNVLIFSLIIGISAVGYASWRIDQAFDEMVIPSTDSVQVSKSAGAVKTVQAEAEQEEENDTFSVLILGRDFRPETGTNLTDVMIVAAIDKKNGKASMVSIPRDTKVYFPEIDHRAKANEAFNLGEHLRKQEEAEGKQPTVDGSMLAKQMAEDVFDIPIDRFVVVDFESFKAIVDAVGGITVDVERDMIYNDPNDGTHINLRAGRQHLNGQNALNWVRHRKDDRGENFYSSDFDRNRRQKEAIKAITSELTSFKGATKLFDVMDAMADHIRTDLSKDELKSLFLSLRNFNLDGIQTLETPNVYWDSVELQTVIPKEDRQLIHEELQDVLEGKEKPE